MQMNLFTMIQIFNQLRSNPNPMEAMQKMLGSNPLFGRAMEMARGKSPEQLKETVMNIAKQRGIDPQQAQQLLSQFGIKI